MFHEDAQLVDHSHGISFYSGLRFPAAILDGDSGELEGRDEMLKPGIRTDLIKQRVDIQK